MVFAVHRPGPFGAGDQEPVCRSRGGLVVSQFQTETLPRANRDSLRGQIAVSS